MTKPPEILARDDVWRTLSAMWARPRPDLAFVIGRRRVGKSFVLSRFARACGGIYYQATRRTESEQLAGLSRVIGDHFGDAALQSGVAFPSWEALFGYLLSRADGAPFLLVLDEFPYLASAAPALPSIVQRLWDHQIADSRMKLVLSGSFITAMTRLEGADQPLYGRRTVKLIVRPFAFHEAAAFLPGYSTRDQLLTYGMIGHLPGHLALVDPGRDLADNVAGLLLEATGRLVDDAAHLLDAFLAETDVPYAILSAIASGAQTWSGLTKQVGRSGGALLRPLGWLEEMDLIERVVPITESRPARSRRALYRITDPYLTFWHRLLAPLIHAGSIGMVDPARLWARVISPALDDHMGGVFEAICRDFVRVTDRLPFGPLRVGEWWDAPSQHQVDVVAVGEADLLVGECKWGPVTGAHLTQLRRRAELIRADLGTGSDVRLHLALFTARGEADETVRAEVEAGRVLLFTAADLLRPLASG